MNWIKQNWTKATAGIIILSGLFFVFLTRNNFYKNNTNETFTASSSTFSSESFLSSDEEIFLKKLTETDLSIMLDEHRPDKFRSSEAVMIRNTIPKDAFLRDFVSLKGVSGFIVLYVLDPSLGRKPLDFSKDGVLHLDYSCHSEDFGQTITGAYKLALLRGGKIINEIEIPFSDYDNWPIHKLEEPDFDDGATGYIEINDVKGVWKNEGELTFRHARCLTDENEENLDTCKGSGLNFLETQQLVPADLTGDDLPHEFRFMTEYLSCGNRKYVIAGYDKMSDSVVIYPIVDDNGEYPSYGDFDPQADGIVIHDSGCDHWAERHNVRQFKFNNQLKKYVQYDSTGTIACD